MKNILCFILSLFLAVSTLPLVAFGQETKAPVAPPEGNLVSDLPLEDLGQEVETPMVMPEDNLVSDLPLVVQAVEEPVVTPDSNIVRSVITEDIFDTMAFYENDTFWYWRFPEDDSQTLIKDETGLPETILCIMKDNSKQSFPIAWETGLADFDPNNGLQKLQGTIVLPEGYVFQNPAFETLFLDVLPLGEAYPVYTIEDFNFGLPPDFGLLLPIGTPPEDIFLDTQQPIGYDTTSLTGAPTFYYPIDWGLESLDTSKTGSTILKGRPDLPYNLQLPQDFQAFLLPITIGAGDFIELSFYGGQDRMGNMLFPWLWEVPDVFQMRILISTDEGLTWEDHTIDPPESENPYLLYSKEYDFIYNANLVALSKYDAKPNTTYWVCFAYEGRESNVLEIITGNEGDASYSFGGDRDGSTDEPLPPLEQPGPDPDTPITPSPESKPESPTTPSPASKPDAPSGQKPLPDEMPNIEQNQPQAVDITTSATPKNERPPITERVTETQSLYSGARLNKMLALDNDFLLFAGDGILAELSSDFLSSLKLSEESTLGVQLESIDPRTFTLEILVDGKALIDIPDTLVRIPTTDGSGLALYDKEGSFVSDALWDPVGKMVTCQLTKTGEYTLAPIAAAQVVPTKQIPPKNTIAPPPQKKEITAPMIAPMPKETKHSLSLWTLLFFAIGCTGLITSGALLFRRWRRG